MIPVSVIIITKNEAEFIAECITAAQLITDDIIVIDNDSTDNTPHIARDYGCRVYQKSWDGYGNNKNKGLELARYNWILSIDADEIADLELVLSLHSLKLNAPNIVYDIKFKSYVGKKPIKHGSWGRDHHIRLFNRTQVKWAEQIVHETLVLAPHIQIQRVDGYLHHYSVKNISECKSKAIYYARLSAEEYLRAGKKATFLSLYITPGFSLFKNYILLLGFLDGKEGWAIARVTYKNKWLKYHYLHRMQSNPQKQAYVKAKLAVEY